jgi:hypothetical protein
MMHFSPCRGIASRLYRLQASRALACVFFCAVFSWSAIVPPTTTPTASAPAAAAPMPHCPSKWIDSLIKAGIRSLDSGNISNARQYFTFAYKCGMSKDSMLYFAAELYIRSFALDTALTFNWGLEKGGHLPRELYLEQRSRIFRLIGWNRDADSLLAIIRKKERHEVSLYAFASRNILLLSPFSLAPINLPFDMTNADIDDIGKGGFRYKWSRYQSTWLKRLSLMLDVNTDLRLPTRYSFDEKTDTLIRSFSFSIGAGDFPSTPECVLGHRIAVHTDNKIDHFNRASCTFPIKKQRFLQIGQDLKWTSDQGIDQSKTELSLMQLSLRRNYTYLCALSLSYNFSKSDIYQDKIDSLGIYRLIPLGYVDSLNIHDSTFPEYRFYRDRNLKVPYTNLDIYSYWKYQPGMRLVTISNHSINAALKSSFQLKLPFNMNLTILNVNQCMWYPKKLEWFSVDDSAKISLIHLYDDYSVVYNASDGKYYINIDRTELYYIKNKLVELKKHEKTRVDCYISLSTTLEKQLPKIGKFYFSATYLKDFSTLTKDDPIVGLDYYWELQAGWKKDISFSR